VLRPVRDRTRSTRIADNIDRADASPFGIRRVFATVARDLYGTKDVQDAITASYVWMADQIGHLTLGLVPTLLLCWFISGVWPYGPVSRDALYVVAAGLVFAYWYWKEQTDKADSKKRAGHTFPFDSGDIDWNVTTALIYFGIGGLLALGAFLVWWLPLAVLVIVLYPALAVAFWWLQRKLAFQQAGLPYLFRLANFTRRLECKLLNLVQELANLSDRKVELRDVLLGRPTERKGRPDVCHILITGTVGAGKTSLCVGIGTEFAFALNRCRYLSASKLVEQVLDPPNTQGDREYDDGRYLWALKSCDLVIADDVDVGTSAGKNGPTEPPSHLINPLDMVKALTLPDAPVPLAWLAPKRSVWVIGSGSEPNAWRNAIAQLMGVETGMIGIVELRGKMPEEPTSALTPMGMFVA
jgi:hypothetical protein